MKPGHYEVMEECKTSSLTLNVGQRVRLIGVSDDHCTVTTKGHTFTFERSDFQRHFKEIQDGEQRYQQELSQEMQAISHLTTQLGELEHLKEVQLSLGQGEELNGAEDLNLSTRETLPIPLENKLVSARRGLLSTKIQIKNLQNEIETRKKNIEQLIEETMKMVRATLEPIREHIEKLEETIWTLELYAGSKEETVQITSGKAAPKDSPITIRQGVLSMAEESLVMIDDDGMDAQDIDKFDDWLRERPERINLFLPEEKGIVAMVPRFQPKRYESSWQEAQWEKENKYTHFLIRNGEKIFRIRTDFFAERTITPTRHEFTTLFEEDVYENGRRICRPMTPGSKAFIQAEKKAEKRHRHYFRVALIIQGVLDRTAMLSPLPTEEGERLVVTTPEAYEKRYIQVIEDVSMALSDPRETFEAWHKRINSEMEIGRRVIGDFRDRQGSPFANHRYDGHYSPSNRIFPRHAERPNSHQPLTIEARRDEHFILRYERIEDVMKRDRWGSFDGYGKAEKRASIAISPEDNVVILFDHPEVTSEKLSEFLGRRQERGEFLTMIPLLKTALLAKRQEEQAEAPFLALLTRYTSTFAIEEAEQDQLAREAITAYKFRHRQHKPLNTSDEGTFKWCCSWLDRNMKKAIAHHKKQQSGHYQKIIEELKDKHPSVIHIALKDDEYQVFSPERQGQTVYMQINQYREKKKQLQHTGTQRWKTMGYPHRRYPHIYTTPEFSRWPLYPNIKHEPTDPEFEILLQQVKENIDINTIAGFTEPSESIITLVKPSDRNTWLVTLHEYHPTRDDKGQVKSFLQRKEVLWRHVETNQRPWEKGGDDPNWHRERKTDGDVFYLNDEKSQEHDLVAEEHRKNVLEQQRQDRALSRVATHLKEQWIAYRWEELYQAFLNEYGVSAMHLWEDHRKIHREESFGLPKELKIEGRQTNTQLVNDLMNIIREQHTINPKLTLGEVTNLGEQTLRFASFTLIPNPTEP